MKNDKKNKTGDARLSYSSSNLVLGCEQKYVHYKVNQVPKDSDVEDSTEAFDIGKAFHKVLEDTLHTNTDIVSNVADACKLYNVKYKQALIEAMVFEYLLLHEASGLDVVVCEIEVNNECTLGFIDAVMKDSFGRWWIVDLKTAGKWDPNLPSKLAMDPQLNLYSYFKDKIAAGTGLDVDKFMGCRYRVTTKSIIKQKEKETYEAFVRRLRKSVKSLDIEIPVSVMDIEGNYTRFTALHARSKELRAGAAPRKNFGFCMNYFKPCEYWSRCYGEIKSNCASKTKLHDLSSVLTNQNLLEEVL